MLSGNFSRSEESKRISGAEDCPSRIAVTGKSSRAGLRPAIRAKVFMKDISLPPRLRFQQELLHAPGLDLRHDDLVRVAAIHHVHHLEASQLLTGMSEFPEDGAVQFHLVNLAGVIPRSRRVPV